jgi:MFS family permease
MSLVPVLLNVVIEAYSWRAAWLVSAVLVWVIVIPIAQWGLIDKPSDVGQVPDGVVLEKDVESSFSLADSYTRAEAIRTSRFWIVGAYVGTVGLLTTALNFHQISMLGEAGMNATQAVAMFLPQVVGAAAAGILFGYLADRLTGRILIPMVMGTLIAALLLTLVLAPGFTAVLYAICLGSAAGATRTVTSTLLPRWFGVGHIGSIQSTIGLIGVASTAFGPVAFAIGREFGGDYGITAAQFAILPVIIGIIAASMRSLPVSVARKPTKL